MHGCHYVDNRELAHPGSCKDESREEFEGGVTLLFFLIFAPDEKQHFPISSYTGRNNGDINGDFL